MTIDCQWVDKNLEAILSDDLTAEDSRLSRAHIGGCEPCRKEVQAMIAVDPLIKKYFQAQLSRATVSRSSGASLWRRRAWTAAAVAAVAAVLFAVVLRSPQGQTNPQPVQTQVVSSEASSVTKDDVVAEERAKPSPAAGDSIQTSAASPADANAPGFLITDLAGYSRSLEDFRGFTTLIGYWHTDQPESITSLEHLYQTFGTNPKLRLAGITSQRVPKPANTTFPVFYNAGSSVLAKPGEFVLLSETGAVRMRGSLSKDFESLSKALQN